MFCAFRHGLLGLVVPFGLIGQVASACIAPERPFLPERPEDVREYADLLRSDFEGYIADIQEYFRCLDTERQRAFQEAREVSEDYGRLVELLE
ncbi:hypothetical protein [Pseudophaeobacter sp. C1-32P7]|jgi:hypothetical protein|uniref:hypothetical protein n=1 Tax=Pseudophaeobacter sp. C1-32P7 TaxID=3098142 RepID=UPI0034D4ECBE